MNWIFIVLVHWNNSPLVDMSLHYSTLCWFRAIKSLILTLNAACLVKQKHQFYILVWPDPNQHIYHIKQKILKTIDMTNLYIPNLHSLLKIVIKGYAERSMIWPQHPDEWKLNRCILKASMGTIFCLQ